MNPQLTTQPQNDYNRDAIENYDGATDLIPALSLDLNDEFIVRNLNATIEISRDWYNDVTKFNLKNKRAKNKAMIAGNQLEENKLYRHQTPFIDNELFVGKDAIIAYVCAQTPRSEVYPANKSAESRQAAKDIQDYQLYHSDKFKLPRKMEGAVDNMISSYIGFIKLSWDPLYGEKGEIVPSVIDPEHIIVDHLAKLGENPRFICHVLKDTVENLCAKFPKKETDILRLAGIQRKGTRNMSAEVVYREVWFTYWDKKTGKPCEAVAWYCKDVVFEKEKDPNWLYKGESVNFLDAPMKPFIPFNISNDGSNWLDKTNAFEQAIPQQEILNKLGRQVMDNLGSANGFKVLDAHAMSSEDAQNFTGDPNQLLLIKTKNGQGVRDAVIQLPPQMVSSELIMQVDKTRQVIHNILATPSEFTGGDADEAKTASQSLMIKNQASGRQDKIVRSIDYAMDLYFKFLTQMMTVWYTDKHYATVNGGDGNFDFIEMHKSKIDKGMTVKVQSGTTLPFDKAREEAVTANLAKLGVLSPYDIYKGMHMDDPQKLYDNYMKWKKDPDSLAKDVASDTADRQAIVDFTELMAGKDVEQRDDPTSAYIEQMRQNLISDEFLKAKKSIQEKVLKFINKALDSLELRNQLEAFTEHEDQNPEPVQFPQALVATGVQQPQPPQPAMPGQAPIPGQVPENSYQQPFPQPTPQMPPQGMPMPQAPQGSPIQAIMQAQPPQQQPVSAPNLSPTAQPQVNAGNVGQL